MRGLGKSSALRIAAAFVLLMLRPSMIVLGVALLDDFSGSHASIQYISDDLEAHQLHPSRQTWVHAAPTKVRVAGAVLSRQTPDFSAPRFSEAISISYDDVVLNGRSHRTASRSPPL